MWPFTSKPKPRARRIISGATASALVKRALQEEDAPNFRVILQKDNLACVSMEEIHALALKHSKPWLKDRWECEDFARNLVNEAQKIAANEGCSWAIGTVRAMVPGWRASKSDMLHVYVWFIDSVSQVHFYDPVALQPAHEDDIDEADYAMT